MIHTSIIGILQAHFFHEVRPLPLLVPKSLTEFDRLMDAHLSSMNYDANKLPLGKLAKSTILNGFAALKVSRPRFYSHGID